MTEEICVRIPHSGSPEQIPIKSYLYDKRIIFLEGAVTTESALSVIRQIMALSLTKEPIVLVITSTGGEITAGLSIIDTMKSCGIPITTVVMCYAYSMGGVISSAGTKRLIMKNSRMMLHQPLISEFAGNVSEIEKLSERMQETKDKINRILAENCKKSLKEVAKVTDKDTFFTAEEAKDFGLVDEIVTDFNDLFGKEN